MVKDVFVCNIQWLCDWNALEIGGTIQSPPGYNSKLQDSWRCRNFPLLKLSPSTLCMNEKNGEEGGHTPLPMGLTKDSSGKNHIYTGTRNKRLDLRFWFKQKHPHPPPRPPRPALLTDKVTWW